MSAKSVEPARKFGVAEHLFVPEPPRNPLPKLLRKQLGLALVLLALAACHSPARTPSTAKQSANVVKVASIGGDLRFWADSPDAVRHFFPASLAERQNTELALSGGSHFGAFGAGFLAGWTKTGKRPEFTIVTGTSTGALIAPFAFLGRRYDAPLRRAFTTVDRTNIFLWRSIIALPFSASLASSAPLKHLIEVNVSERMIEEIAAEHRRGRRLFILTTNFDAQRAVIWDMGAIAASGSPSRVALFRQVLLASASLPALMPPVLIPVTGSDGSQFDEMHFDGGVMLPILTIPEALMMKDQAPPARLRLTTFAILNNRLEGMFDMVEPKIDKISWHVVDFTAMSHASAILQNTYFYAIRHGLDFRFTYIDHSFRLMPDKRFDPGYMRALYAYGFAKGELQAWHSGPIGI